MKNLNNITFRNITDCFNINIIEGNEVYHKFDEHFHNSYNIGVLKNGEVIFKIDKMEERVNQEIIYLINPKIIHSIVPVDNSAISYIVINCEEKEFNKIFKNKNLIFREHFIKDKIKSEKVIKCIERILNKNSFSLEKQEALIEILEEFQIESREEKIVKKDNIENAIKYIKANYKKEMNLTYICSLSFLSLFHFIREFKKYVGLSPFEFIIQLRIKEAQRLLLKSNKIAEIAIEAGFYDQSHFTKYFQKYVGISPKKYLQSCKINKVEE